MPDITGIMLAILLSEIFNVTGHILFKKGINAIDAGPMRGWTGHVEYFRSALGKSSIWIGFGFQVLCVAAWLVALAQADLSFVFPVGSVQYIFILFGAHIFLGEKIDRMKVAGTILVIAGIALIAVS
ncbi:MAG: EamA family transporter [Candidatus Omnitrophota bacterium]|nr:EamA family transporter [Candidatus Omnitrophota bacterium]